MFEMPQLPIYFTYDYKYGIYLICMHIFFFFIKSLHLMRFFKNVCLMKGGGGRNSSIKCGVHLRAYTHARVKKKSAPWETPKAHYKKKARTRDHLFVPYSIIHVLSGHGASANRLSGSQQIEDHLDHNRKLNRSVPDLPGHHQCVLIWGAIVYYLNCCLLYHTHLQCTSFVLIPMHGNVGFVCMVAFGTCEFVGGLLQLHHKPVRMLNRSEAVSEAYFPFWRWQNYDRLVFGFKAGDYLNF